MELIIASDVMFLTLVKKIWEMLKETYAHEKNISWVFEIYEWLFSLQQGDQSVQDLYTFLRAFMDELEIHQLIVFDAKILKEYRDGLAVAKFLSALRPDVCISDSWVGTWCRYISISILHIYLYITCIYQHP